MIDLPLIGNGSLLRTAIFISILIAVTFWEFASPRRIIKIPRLIRWTNNLAIVVLNALLVRLIFPLTAVGLAQLAQTKGWGLFNGLNLPVVSSVIAVIIIFDLAIYLQHRLFHAVPFLWRFHRMHHADTAFDVTNGLRFHPIEILLSMGLKMLLVLAIGPPAIAIIIFEVMLNATAMFNHANINIPRKVDRVLRLFVVTPDMHRIHHSPIKTETDSNFGFNQPWWDRLFGTYIAQPANDHKTMLIGLHNFRDPRELRLDKMLTQPLRDDQNSLDLTTSNKSNY